MKVLKSWGTDGRVLISMSSSDSGDLKINEPVFITFDGLPVPFFVESVERKGNRFIVKLEDIDTLDGAEELVGRDAGFNEKEETEDEDSIVGMIIIDAETGEEIGPVTDFVDYSGNTCITVDYNGKEIVLPLHEDLIKKITKKKITLTIPSGLLDI